MTIDPATLTVTIRAKDEVSPVLRRIGWSLVVYRWRDRIVFAAWSVAIFAAGLIAGAVIR